MKNIKQIWFDLDNTLVDRNAAMEKALLEWLTRHTSLSATEQQALLPEAMQFDNWGYTTRTEFAEWLLKKTDTHWEGPIIEVARGILRMVPPYIRPYEASHKVLEFCKSQYSIGMLTNGPSEVQREKIRYSGLEHHFQKEKILVSGEIGFDKPSREAFLHLQKISGVQPEEILYVGDDPGNDVAGAATLGVASCWVSFGRKFPLEDCTPTYTIQDISELMELVRARKE